ncbi:serine/threonine-protein kinase, partial [Janibacter massiliensis]|uniref:serine/threonine-protein kinase n=1 Tax=Janibacter massiliensis TaxID=2058291 RepID=UPI000D0FC1D2
MSTTVPPRITGLDYVQPLGAGGYADVFLYQQQMPRMRVAVKVLKTDGMTPSIIRQFNDEADTMAELSDHPFIVQVFSSGTTEDGRPYLVMKYYPPPNLAARARAERFPVQEVLRTGVQLASAVETAHRAGILHRDIKPANVLVSQYGTPGLTDFGIAGRGAAGEEPDDDVGVSVPWAPPEVLFGQSNGDVRGDVYSLGATLWQLLVGRSPFEVPGGDNGTSALMPRIRSNPPPATGRPDVPPSLERLLAQAMAKNPASRPPTAIDLARSLQSIEQEQRYPRTAVVVPDEPGAAEATGAAHARPRGRAARRAWRPRVGGGGRSPAPARRRGRGRAPLGCGPRGPVRSPASPRPRGSGVA